MEYAHCQKIFHPFPYSRGSMAGIKKFILLSLFICFSKTLQASIPLEDLSLEEKVGQLLTVHFQGESPNEDARALIQEIKVGGIIYYNWSNGLDSPTQVQRLSSGLQQLAQTNPRAIPLLITADQEGGIVNRLSSGFTVFPGNMALGATENTGLAEAAAYAMGQEMRAVGVNMNLAPVVDINKNPRNPVIGVRSFAESPEIVCAFGERALFGYRRSGVIATLKHFPGHGDVEVDSHESLPTVKKTLAELQSCELLPFSKLASVADVIMPAHILVPALDPKKCTTLSEKSLKYLRDDLGFQGVIITDSLVMGGVLSQCSSVDEAAIQAFLAGCDILLLGGRQLNGEQDSFELTVADVRRIHQSIIAAVKSGRISEERINGSVAKILSLKKRHLGNSSGSIPNISDVVNTENHRALARQIAALALEITSENEAFLFSSICHKKMAIFCSEMLKENLSKPLSSPLEQVLRPCFFRARILSKSSRQQNYKLAQQMCS